MKPDFNIGARNGLLDQKHVNAMGQAIWLYLWFLDKQPKDSELVLGGKPITHEFVAETFTELSHRSYVRWLAILTKGNYISLTRTPRGCVVAIEKSKKWVKATKPKVTHRAKSDTPKMAHQSKSDTPNVAHDTPNVAERYAKNGSSNIRETVSDNQKQLLVTKVTMEKAAVDNELETVSKLYYQVIKAYNLPILNNNVIRAKIKTMATEDEHEKIIGYLNFLLTQYQAVEMDFKPRISTALDIYAKRVQIRVAIEEKIKGKNRVSVKI